MKLTSTAFEHDGLIPPKHTCDGDGLSPELIISGVPEGAKSLVMIMDDPDVPKSIREDGIWDHWIVFNIPATTTRIPEGQEPGGVPGSGTAGNKEYYGPCPPDREHRYFFRLFALDTALNLKEGASRKDVETAMEGHVLESSELMGKYKRK